MSWTTKITKVEPNKLITCGYSQEELIGNIPFSHVVYLLLKGELPSKQHGTMIDAILTACIDHGVTPPSGIAARTVASGGVPLPSAVAAGILSIGDAHGGAIEKGAKYFQEKMNIYDTSKQSINIYAQQLVEEAKKTHSRILGFGHRVHTNDPRTKKLFTLANKLNITGSHIKLAQALETELEKIHNRKIPINVDGAIAAIISDMNFDWRLGKAFFLLGRVAGLTAQVYEEQTTQKPMRQIFTTNCTYNGSIEQPLPEK
jgi:citrate synthase